MRLGRLVLAGLVAGAVAGFLVALLRPRGTHPASSTVPAPPPAGRSAPLTEPSPAGERPPAGEPEQPSAPTVPSAASPYTARNERSRAMPTHSDHGVAGRQTGAGAHD